MANETYHFIGELTQDHNIYFSGGSSDNKTLFTITQDGKLIIGDGISQDEATQAVAKMLVDMVDQEVMLRINVELAEARAQIAKLKDLVKMQDVELQRLFKRLQKVRRLGPLIGSGETDQ